MINHFQKVTYIVFMLSLLLMSTSVGYSGEISKTVQYRADLGLFRGIDKDYSIPKDGGPVYLYFKFVLSPGYIAADLTGEVIFDQDNRTITINGTEGEFLTTGGILLNGNIVLDFEIPTFGLTISETLPIPKFPQINKGWDDSVKFRSFLLDGQTAELEARIRELVSVQLSAIDITKLLLDAATGGATQAVPQSAIDAIKQWTDGGLQINGGLSSDLELSGEAISVNGKRILSEGRSISAPGLDLSQSAYEVDSEYLEHFTYNLNFLVSSDFYVAIAPPLLGAIWDKQFEIAEVPIEIVSDREGDLDFRSTPNPIVFPIEETPTNRAPQIAGTIDVRPLTMGDSATTVDVSSYFSDPDNDRLTYSGVSNNRSVATVAVAGSQVTITPSGQGSAEIVVRATDPGGSTATQRFTVTVQAAHSCTYNLSPSSKNISAAGESISVTVTTADECPWVAWSNDVFLSVSPYSGTGNGTVTITVDENTAASSRTGNVTIADKTFTVNQVSSSNPATQTDLAIQSFEVSKTTLTPGESFTLLVTVNNNGPGNSGNVGISYYHSAIQGLSPQDRVQWQGTVWVDPLASGANIRKSIKLNAPSTLGTYYYGAWLAGDTDDTNIYNNVATEVGVTVSSSTGCVYALGSTSRDITAASESFTVTVSTTIGCDWSVINNNSDFLSVSPSSGTGSGTVTVTANRNTRTARTGTLTIAGEIFTVNQAGSTNDGFEINIPDRYLRAKIERALNKRAGDPITAAEMATLTRLDASHSRISDLTGLKLAANLTSLNLYNNRLTTLLTGVFEGLNKVTSLGLRSNPLTTIKTGAFNGLSSLTELDLSHMRVATIEGGAFNGMSNLRSLNLYNNSIKTLPIGVFEGLNKVTSLNLRSNSLTTIKAGAFNGLSSLQSLDLSHMRVATIEGGAFSGLSNLRSLNLYNNSIKTLPIGVFEGLNKVTSLGLRSNPLTTIKTGAFNGLSSLQSLDLSHMRVATIEGGAFNGMSNLRSLNLYNNSIKILPIGVFQGLNRLTSLNLRSNSLTTIKTGAFSGLSSLQSLDLSHMRLVTIEGGAFNGMSNLRSLNLYNNSIKTLSTDVFKGLNKVTELNLRSNSLTTIKTGAFSGLSSLQSLDLSHMRVATIEGGAFNGMSNLRSLNLYNNSIKILPIGVFQGLNRLTSLNLNGNPGTPFALTLELVRTDTTDLAAPGPATVVLQLAQGAPFEMTVNLSVEGGTLSATTATIERGKTQSDPITMTQSGRAPATIYLGAAPRVPRGYYGIQMAVGSSLSTGVIPPHALEKISGDTQEGTSGVILENPFVVEVQDAANRGFKGVDVTFTIIAGGGTLSETTVTTGADGHAESWLTLGSQPGPNAVRVSVKGISQSVTFNALAKSLIFDLSVPSGTSLIHVPLKVTTVDGVEYAIEFISDLYDALGGASTVNFLVTHDPNTQDFLNYFGVSDKGTSADKRLADDTGVMVGMKAPVSVRLQGNALGTNGSSTITLNQGINLVGMPLRDSRVVRVSDLFALEGISGNVPIVTVSDNGEFKIVGQADDPGDIEITGGQAFMLTAQRAATVTISGDGWTNDSATAAAPVSLTGMNVGNTTPVLALKGSIVDEETSNTIDSFRVIVKNLSTGKAVATITQPDEEGYQLTVVDIETMRAAQVGDVLEISAQTPDPFIGVEPLQYTVTAEDVKRSLIQLPVLIAYATPTETELLPNYPNPFNPETWIPYRLAEDAFVTLTIYDSNGQVVRTLDVGHRIAAVYETRSKAIYWDGRNEFGEQVASGIYFYQLRANSVSLLRKMLILK